MANKYLIHGATFNGDGTTSSEAASAWAAWAWNHIDIIAGTAVWFGSISAWDVIFIRSKTWNGANENVTYAPWAAKNYGSSAGTVANPVVWVLDNGDVWSWIDGTLTVTGTTSAHTNTFLDYNDWHSQTKWNLKFENTSTTPTFGQMTFNKNNTYGMNISIPNSTTSGWFMKTLYGVHTDMYIKSAGLSATYWIFQVLNSRTVWINPTFEVTTAPATMTPLISTSANHSEIDIRGWRVFGAWATSGNLAVCFATNYLSYTTRFTSVWFQTPKVMPLSTAQIVSWGMISMSGLDDGWGGAIAMEWWDADSRNISNNYPTLNATLADSANTPSSWRIYPKYAGKTQPFDMVISKLFTDTPATKTITLHFLATTGWSWSITPDTSTVWMNVNYLDNATWLPVMQSTKVRVWTSLTTSGLTWSPSNSWGAASLTAYKLELTTTASIKQDTAISISFMWSAVSWSANDILIFCPDIQLS